MPDSWNELFVATLWQLKVCRTMLESTGYRSLQDLDQDGFLELVDGWGNPLIYVTKVSHTDDYPWDDFLPEHPHPFLASSGPDGVFGHMHYLLRQQTASDNLYSFDPN